MKAAKKAIGHLLQCKAEGICERDKLVNAYLRVRVENFERRMETVNELFRSESGLPPCPPDCDVPVVKHLEIDQ